MLDGGACDHPPGAVEPISAAKAINAQATHLYHPPTVELSSMYA